MRKWLPWSFSALCGAIWGLGASRVLALELHSPFFFQPWGTAIGGALGIGFALLLARWLYYRHRLSPWDVWTRLLPLGLPLVDLVQRTPQPWRGPIVLAASLVLTGINIIGTMGRGMELILAVGIPFAIYLPDLSPYLGRADTFEFQVIASQLGIAHPSGYPLYTLLGKLFSLLPFGSPAWRINLSSAIFAALASGMLYLALIETNLRICKSANCKSRLSPTSSLPPKNLLSLFAALTLAFSPTLWSRAIEAEVYALNAFLIASGIWLAVRWSTGQMDTTQALPCFGLLIGLALTSHLTLGALGLLILPLLFTLRPRPKFRTLLITAGLGIACLALYLYIPLRWPAVTGGERMSFSHFFRFITNADSGGALRPLAFIKDLPRWGLVFRLLRAQVGWIGLGIAMIGLGWLFLKRWPLAIGTLFAFSAWVWFNLGFYVADPDYSAFLIPAHVILIFWLGTGMQAGIKLLDAWHKGAAARGSSGAGEQLSSCPLDLHSGMFILQLAVPLLALFPLSRLWVTGPTLDTISVGRADEAWGRYVLQLPLALNAAILADSEKFPPLYYLQQLEGIRPDLELVMLFNEAQYREALESRITTGQKVYMARYLPGLDAFGVSSVGPLVEVAPIDTLPATTLLIRFSNTLTGDILALETFHLEQDLQNRPMHHLTLTWLPLTSIQTDLEIRLRLVEPSTGNTIWDSQPARPVNGYTTTQTWKVDPDGTRHRIHDYHPLEWPVWIAAGTYRLDVAVFPRFAAQGLSVNSEDNVWFPLDTLTVPAQKATQLPTRCTLTFSNHNWIIGADFAPETWAATEFNVNLAWEFVDMPEREEKLQWRWVPLDRTKVVGDISQNTPILSTTATYTPNISISHVYPYMLTTPTQPGQYQLEVGWNTDQGDFLPARCAWLGQPRNFCRVGEIYVGPSNTGIANFDNQILLLAMEFNAEGVAARGPLSVNLTWRGLHPITHDYTVFVQVIGPEGKLYGQVDSWPVQGTRPTHNWEVGEEIADPYQFYLEESLTAGQYQIIVGWYLLADMRRLPVLNSDGQIVGDFVIVGEFSLQE
ncbi:MAG: DUF2723 domain-containing protein [Anaerolineae bacterium]|nr:DUF2723 domain-containing protein [Anaerolineae bacterium]